MSARQAKLGAAGLPAALAALKRRATAKQVGELTRYGIVAKQVLGVAVRDVQAVAKELGRDHALAEALFKSGIYEARLLAAFVEEVDRVTPSQMDRWAKAFENWADCDTIIMHCFDRTPHAWPKAKKWCATKPEFVKRAGFAMLASMSVHHKGTPDKPFIDAMRLIEAGADDERNFVKKAVNWALRAIGSRSAACRAAALRTATRLAARDDAASRWVGKDALRYLEKRPRRD